MAYCPNCGSPVEGNFCAKCGAAVGVGSAPASSSSIPTERPPDPAASGLTDNVAGALCYTVIIGIVFLLMEPYNRNKLIRFHAFQALFLCGALIVVNIVFSALISMMWGLYFLFTLLHLAALVLWLFLMFKTFSGEKIVLPIIGPLAEKQA
jgi:uncharacterized membrane protein